MNDYNNGEIWGWNGGECPVHPQSEVMVWMRCGDYVGGWQASTFGWGHGGGGGVIVCFQVTKVHVEPKVIWVNEYKEGDVGHSFPTEEQANRQALRGVTRVAVKYVEVKE